MLIVPVFPWALRTYGFLSMVVRRRVWMFAELVVGLEALDVGSLPRRDAEAALASSSRVRRWLDGLDLRLAARISACADRDPASKPAEESIATATRTSPRAARRVVRRADTTAKVAELAGGLGSGGVSGEHIDVITQGLARLPAERRRRFAQRYGARMAAAAAQVTPEELRVDIERWVREFDTSDGVERLASQQRQVSMRAWCDRVSGMWRFAGQLDPASGLVMSARLRSTMEMLFRERTPDGCPDDPIEKQAFLRAHALIALTGQPVSAVDADGPGRGPASSRGRSSMAASSTAKAPSGGDVPPDADVSTSAAARSTCACGRTNGSVRWRTDAVVVIDERTLLEGWHPQSHVDLGGDAIVLPLETIRRIVATSRVVPVVRGADGVVVRVGDGRSPLDLGRSTRLASWAQRHALRVMHPTCGVPGCDVPFTHCQPHHVIWWEHEGDTDLSNLLPLCSRHHHAVHDSGWRLHLARDRTVTVTMPDGTSLVGRLERRWPR